jgi:hypothetical protein
MSKAAQCFTFDGISESLRGPESDARLLSSSSTQHANHFKQFREAEFPR